MLFGRACELHIPAENEIMNYLNAFTLIKEVHNCIHRLKNMVLIIKDLTEFRKPNIKKQRIVCTLQFTQHTSVSLLDNAHNWIVGCIIQKRCIAYRVISSNTYKIEIASYYYNGHKSFNLFFGTPKRKKFLALIRTITLLNQFFIQEN